MRDRYDGWNYSRVVNPQQVALEEAQRERDKARAALDAAERKLAVLRNPWHGLENGQGRIANGKFYAKALGSDVVLEVLS